MGTRTPIWGTRSPCWRFLMADLCRSEVVAEGNRRSQAKLTGVAGVPMGSSQGLLTGCCHQAGGLLWEGKGAELAPGCPTPRKGSGVPHLHPQPPSLPAPGQESLGSQPGSRCVPVDVDTNPSRTGLRPRARGLPAPKPWGHSCCQPGPGANTGVCGKCLSPGEWDGLQRNPQSRWSQTPQIPPVLHNHSLLWVDLCAPPCQCHGGLKGQTQGYGDMCRGHTWAAVGTQ